MEEQIGRHRTQTPPDEELAELGEDLVKWALDASDSGKRLRYCDWYVPKGFIEKQWQHMREKPIFQWYYERARQILGIKYMDGTVNQSIAHRFLRVYCPEVKLEEDQESKYKADLKKEEDKEKNQKIVFEVNYANDPDNPVKISSKTLPSRDPSSSE